MENAITSLATSMQSIVQRLGPVLESSEATTTSSSIITGTSASTSASITASTSASITTSIITSSTTRTHTTMDGYYGWNDVDALVDYTVPDTLDLTHSPPTPGKENAAKRRK
jgi:hypothetical protein